MKKNLTKLMALIVVLTITLSNPTTALAYFAPSNNTPDVETTYSGFFVIPSDIAANENNKLIVTMANADLTSASGAILTYLSNDLVADVEYDNDLKTITFTFCDALQSGFVLDFLINGIVSPAGTHPYRLDLYTGETDTTINVESGDYIVTDGNILVNITVEQFLSFGLMSDYYNLVLAYTGSKGQITRDIGYYVATNAQSYSVSAKLKTDFSNGTIDFPYNIPAEFGGYVPNTNLPDVTGVLISLVDADNPRGNAMLKGNFAPLTISESILLTTGSGTNGDNDMASLAICGDGRTPAGTYQGVIELTCTPTF